MPDRRTAARFALAAALALACSQQRDAAPAGTSFPGFGDSAAPTLASMVRVQPSSTEARPVARPRGFDLCRLLPVDSVARSLRQTVAKSVTVAAPRSGGMCTYRDVARSPASVRVLIDVGRDRSAAAAGVAYLATREQLGARGIATTDVARVGDAAFGMSDTAGQYDVMMQQGAVTGRVTVSVRGARAESLRPAAVSLARQTLAALAATQ